MKIWAAMGNEVEMYTFDSRVRYSEVGEDGKITISALMDYMQDCTNFQSEDLGVGLAFHREKALMWVLNSWQIIFNRFPSMGERITVGTQSYGCRKMIGYRNFLVTDSQGEQVAIANSLWVLIDLKRGRPIVITPEIGDVYGKHEPLEMAYASRKISVPEGGEVKESIIVREYHLDTNHHVNNRQYVQIAMEFLEKDAVVGELRVEYKKQAVLGDEMIPVVYHVSEKEMIILLRDGEGKPYATTQFFLA